ncbi:glycerol uptake facilitator-like aquaporin [Panacagrimonas perspica]|uniref:Glycerol uptake facilitator-like aquaporin n=1 Tax=Panacagrimonas perspica TaxID=381431 RepID=A0A4S3JZQ8_9GAMM|nr:MIP/aquaporin family protein [Panacagrimonas perspica]TDU32193.1 glycerol uptake facilitator-like aquaporin [Panacagrimonas perspica]THD01109.1 aquaporin family protein [Panacagrimonas perspica]
MTLARRAVAEGLGTAMLLAVVVGSGIMGERLAAGNLALALLANSVATGGGLIALILTFGPISGAQFNPLVTLSLAVMRLMPWREVPPYVVAQIIGGVVGVWAAHLMFGETVFQFSVKARPGMALAWSEVVASFGLLMVILSGVRHRAEAVPYAVAAYIVGAYWFTASTSFANPAVTIARSLTNTFAGVRPQDVPTFIVAQFAGAAAATLMFAWLFKAPAIRAQGRDTRSEALKAP